MRLAISLIKELVEQRDAKCRKELVDEKLAEDKSQKRDGE